MGSWPKAVVTNPAERVKALAEIGGRGVQEHADRRGRLIIVSLRSWSWPPRQCGRAGRPGAGCGGDTQADTVGQVGLDRRRLVGPSLDEANSDR